MEKGGLPGICFLRKREHRNSKFKSHLQTLLQRDLRLVLETTVPYQNILLLLKYTAENQGTPFIIREASQYAGVAQNTIFCQTTGPPWYLSPMAIWKLQRLAESRAELDATLNGIADRILALCPNAEVRVFGSAARGNRRVGSDIDIAVIFESRQDLINGRRILFAHRLADEALDLIFFERADYDRMKDIGGIAFDIFHHGRHLRGEHEPT